MPACFSAAAPWLNRVVMQAPPARTGDAVRGRMPVNHSSRTRIQPLMRHFRQDLRDALRRLGHDPAYAAVAVLTLALGIGANTAMFSVIRTVLLKPLPYGDPDRVVMIWNAARPGDMTWVSTQEVVAYAEAGQSFERFSAYGDGFASLTGGHIEPERVPSASVKTDLFDTLQVQPASGRAFSAADGAPGATPVVIIGDGLWQRRF